MCLRVWGLTMGDGSRACEVGEASEALSSTEGPKGPKVCEAHGVCRRGGYPLLLGELYKIRCQMVTFDAFGEIETEDDCASKM